MLYLLQRDPDSLSAGADIAVQQALMAQT